MTRRGGPAREDRYQSAGGDSSAHKAARSTPGHDYGDGVINDDDDVRQASSQRGRQYGNEDDMEG